MRNSSDTNHPAVSVTPGDTCKPLPEVVYKWLHAAILDGEFAPGQMLRQDSLARRLGVSRVPLREALQRLEGEGQVVLHPRRGYAVVSLDLEEIEEIFRLRVLLDERAAYHSTLARTPEHIAELRRLLERMESVDPDDEEQVAMWSRLNSDFHDILLSAGKHRHLARVAKESAQHGRALYPYGSGAHPWLGGCPAGTCPAGRGVRQG